MASPSPSSSPAALAFSEIPRTSVLEFVRDARHIRRDMLGCVRRRYERHGPVVRQNQGIVDMISLAGPEAARLVLLDRDDTFSAKKSWDFVMGKIFSNGLLLRDGDDHRFHRRLLREAFRTPALEAYLASMNNMLGEMLEGWETAPGQSLLAFDKLKHTTLDVACRIFLGMAAGEKTEKLNHAFEAAVAASMSLIRLPVPGLEFNRGLQGRRYMVELLSEWIPQRRASQGGDIFTRLCQTVDAEGNRLEDQEIIDHMIFLMMAAHDTTTSTLTSLLYELAVNPQWQDRLREEVRSFQKPAIEFDDLLGVKDMILVIQETLRRYPPLSTIPRGVRKDFEWGGYQIREGAMVAIYPIHTHHQEEWWNDPYRFDPERFSPGREEHKRHSHSYTPFGGGDHMCLGLRFAELQMKAVLFQLLQRYEWSVPEGYRMPVQQAPISKPIDGLPLTVRKL